MREETLNTTARRSASRNHRKQSSAPYWLDRNSLWCMPSQMEPRCARLGESLRGSYLEFSGQQPVLEGANQSFEEVARERKNVAA